MKILVVEDDEGLSETLRQTLTSQHYLVECAVDGQTGWELTQAFEYDLILLDWMLPDLEGVWLCQQLRAQSDLSSLEPLAGGSDGRLNQTTPVILLTAHDSSTNRVAGLDAGADDYVIKPFDAQELLARIRALLRRGKGARSPIIYWGNLQLNPTSCEVTYDNQLLRLTSKEYELLELFLRNPQRIFSQSFLIERLWFSDNPPTENAVRTHIKSLRQKLKKVGAGEVFETVYGLGYRLKEARGERQAVEAVERDSTPPLPTPHSPPATDVIQPELATIWKKYQQGYCDRLAVIEQAIAALMQGSLSESLRKRASQEAHTLVGSLGSFGLHHATQLAREIEPLLKLAKPLNHTQIRRLSELAVSLRRAVVQSNDIKSNGTHDSDLSVPDYLPGPTIQSARLLIVDDDVGLAAGLVAEAANWGIQATIATTLVQARNQVHHLPPDVVLLDLNFPESIESGMDLLAELAVHQPSILVVVFTAKQSLAERLKVAQLRARVFLHKPVAPSEVIRAIAHVLQQSAPPTGTLLVVDDDPGMLATLRSLLSPWGFNLTLLSRPRQFWEILQQTTPDLLILDIEMPEVSGIDLCRVVRNDPQWNELPVLILSVHTDAETITRVFTSGADDYISKPIAGPELIARIINRLERVRITRQLMRQVHLLKSSTEYRDKG